MRIRFTLLVAVVALVRTSAPAFAHEEIAPPSFPTGRPAFLNLTAANEASVDLVRIVLRASAGLAFGEATRSPAGWSAAATDTAITWTGGAVKPHTFETWGFEVGGVDQPGTLAFTVTLGYAGGKTDEHEVEVTAVAPGGGGAGAAGTPAPTVSVATTPSTAPAGRAPAPLTGSDDASGTATVALALSIIALLVAAGTAAAARRRAAPAGDGAPGAAQDW